MEYEYWMFIKHPYVCPMYIIYIYFSCISIEYEYWMSIKHPYVLKLIYIIYPLYQHMLSLRDSLFVHRMYVLCILYGYCQCMSMKHEYVLKLGFIVYPSMAKSYLLPHFW